MANVLLTISKITRESMIVLENLLVMTKYVRRDLDTQFGVAGAKIGTTVNVRKPPRYEGRTGQAISLESAVETQVPLTLDTQFGVDLEFTSVEMGLEIDDFSDRIIYPAIAVVANKIDRDGLLLYKDIYNTVGTPGSSFNTLKGYLQVGQKLNEEAAPKAPRRSVIIDPEKEVDIVDALKGLFQESTSIAEQYKRGTMGYVAGFRFSMDQNVVSHVVGPLGGSPLVDGASQTGSSLLTKGWTSSAASRLLRGDVFTIAGVNAVNPQNRQDTGSLRQFVATSDFSSDGSGNGTVGISPAITPSGPFKTVTASPADSAVITVLGAADTVTPQGLGFHRDAFVFASADLLLPGGVDKAARVSDKQLGMSIRMIRDYDINQDRLITRLDILYGWATLYPELACRIAS